MAGEPKWFSGTPFDVGNLRCLLRNPSKSPETHFDLHSLNLSLTHPASKIHTCYVTPLYTLADPSNPSNKHMIEHHIVQKIDQEIVKSYDKNKMQRIGEHRREGSVPSSRIFNLFAGLSPSANISNLVKE